MVGTTEFIQSIDDPLNCTEFEKEYLLELYNYYFDNGCTKDNICGHFAGLRPLIYTDRDNPGDLSREYVIEHDQCLLTVFGGKWTTARILGERVAAQVNKLEI
jgi:glycerol-3-phosphate dehydrogenase